MVIIINIKIKIPQKQYRFKNKLPYLKILETVAIISQDPPKEDNR